MGLKLGVLSGGKVYLNHIAVQVETSVKQRQMVLHVENVEVQMPQGYEVDIADGVTIKYLGKSSGNVCRIEVDAPDEVCVSREEAYQSIVGSTGGLLVAKNVYDWFRDWKNYSKEDVWSILARSNYKGDGDCEVDDYQFTIKDNVVINVEIRGNVNDYY
ncbi:hypothetical protein [Vibrio phage V-YDF132]|nr:hypothetical protein [Vibrio phage V-YDF132]